MLRSSERKEALLNLAVFCAYCAIAVAITWPLILNPAGLLLGQSTDDAPLPQGDVNCFLWAFWWFRKALGEGYFNLFYTTYQAAPRGMSLLTTPITPLNALISVPLQSFLPLVAIYNLFVLLSLVLSAFFTFLFARLLQQEFQPGDRSRAVPFFCGCAYGFTSFHEAHWGHLNLLSTQWIPFTLWAVWRLRLTGRTRWAVVAGAGMALEAWSSWYLTVFLCFLLAPLALILTVQALSPQWAPVEKRMRKILWIALAVVFCASNIMIRATLGYPSLFFLYGGAVVVLYIRSHPHGLKRLGRIALIPVVFGMSTAPMFLPLLNETSQERVVEQTPFMSSMALSAGPESWLVPHRAAIWIDSAMRRSPWPYVRRGTEGTEFSIFPGYTLLVLALFLLAVRQGRGPGRYWLFLAALFIVLSWGPALVVGGRLMPSPGGFDGIILPALSLQILPIVSGLRAMVRFSVVVPLALGAWVACQGSAVLPGGRKARWVFVLAATTLMMVERFPHLQRIGPVQKADGYATLSRLIPEGAIALGLPLNQAAPMLYCQTFHERQLVNFFGARVSEDLKGRFVSSAMFEVFHTARTGRNQTPDAEAGRRKSQAAAMELKSWGCRYILIHRALCKPGEEKAFAEELAGWRGWGSVEETPEYALYAGNSNLID